MSEFRCGVVIPTCAGREENLRASFESLVAQTYSIERIVVVHDGGDPVAVSYVPSFIENAYVAKHRPGLEQPRNIGAQRLQEIAPDCTHVWFVDSDVVLEPTALEAFAAAAALHDEPRILIGPYDFLAPGETGLHPEARQDLRWNSFDDHGPEEIHYHPVAAGCACFSGNLVWPLKEFLDIGGFWNELHHGRCEDGELGIRATMAGIGVSFVRGARGYHQWHPADSVRIEAINRRDVPMINRRHPFMPDGVGDHLLMTAKDGIRFDFRCPACDKRMNSLLYWEHCGGTNWECTATN
jgi:GT2 family glycosyltransferase